MIIHYQGLFKFQRAIAASDLPSTTRLVAVMLAMYANHETGECYPSHATLAEACGLSRRSVVTHVAALEALGWVEVKHVNHQPCQYMLRGGVQEIHTSEAKGCEGDAHQVCNPFTWGVQQLHRGCEGDAHKQLKEQPIEETKEQEPPQSHSSEVYTVDARAMADSGEGGLLEYFESAPKQDTSYAQVSASERIRARWCAVYEGNAPGELDRLIERYGVVEVEGALDETFSRAVKSPVRYLRAALMSRQGQEKRGSQRAFGGLY